MDVRPATAVLESTLTVQSVRLVTLRQDPVRLDWVERSGPRPASKKTPRVTQRLTETTMSDPHLPAEILDYIVDHLHDAKDTLRNCGIVSKSWVPRTRNHLFADIDFRTVEVLESWKKSFPDPSTSPARYTRTLSVGRPDVITAADAEAGGWITGFSRVVHLEVDDHKHFFSESEVSLVPLHGLSPIVKSLRIFTPSLRFLYVFNLILSFPLLEDLDVTVGMPEKEDSDGTEEVQRPTAVQLSSPPRFTGTLELCLGGKIGPVARRLLSLPSGIHFRKITLVWLHKDDLPTITAFVEKCSHSLESLDIAWNVVCKPILHLCPHR